MPQPNILVFVTDHLSRAAVGAYGDARQCTPNVDRIASRGVRVDEAYTPCPLCMPARASFWTSRHVHQTGVWSNGRQFRVPPLNPTLGSLFTAAGYRCLHYGKTHDAGSLMGFLTLECWHRDVVTRPPYKPHGATRLDAHTADRCVQFLQQRNDRPWLLVADLANPHDICQWVGEHAGPHENDPIDADLPPLPANFERLDFDARPIAVRSNCCSNRRVAQTRGWTPENFRHYLAAFYYYVELVDRDIGRILDALEQCHEPAETVIVLTADHGDAMAAHRLVTKAAHFYDEVTRVPLILAGPGLGQPDRRVHGVPASTLDLLPTLCDVAGVEPPEDVAGCSLLPLLRGAATTLDREYITSTWHGGDLVTPGRMVRTRRYKYTHFREDGGEELYDMIEDPGETRTLVRDPGSAEVLDRHRGLLRAYCQETGDPFFEQEAVLRPGQHTHGDRPCPALTE